MCRKRAGTLLLDVTHRRWSKEVAEAAGIPESWLPKVYESPEVCARISEKAAGLTGLKAGTPVVAGAGDQGAGAVGMGILQPGSVSATIGTSGVVFAATANPTKDPKGRLHTFCHAVPGVWHVMGVTQSAGLSLRWLKETFFAGQNYDAMSAAAEKVPAGSDGLMWAPYLLGERTPHLDPEVRAAFAGIRRSTRRRISRGLFLRVWRIRCRIPLRCLRNWEFRECSAVWAAAARAGRCGGAFKLGSTDRRSKCSRQRKAARLDCA